MEGINSGTATGMLWDSKGFHSRWDSLLGLENIWVTVPKQERFFLLELRYSRTFWKQSPGALGWLRWSREREQATFPGIRGLKIPNLSHGGS